MFKSRIDPSFQLSENPVKSLREFVSADRLIELRLHLLHFSRQSRHRHVDGIDSGLERFQTRGVLRDVADHAQASEQSEPGANHDQSRLSRRSQGL